MIPKLATLAVSAALAASMAAPVTAFAKNGVYTASSVGRNGSINVQVTIKNDAIADIKIVDWSETHPVADLTKTKLIPDIIKYQSRRHFGCHALELCHQGRRQPVSEKGRIGCH